MTVRRFLAYWVVLVQILIARDLFYTPKSLRDER